MPYVLIQISQTNRSFLVVVVYTLYIDILLSLSSYLYHRSLGHILQITSSFSLWVHIYIMDHQIIFSLGSYIYHGSLDHFLSGFIYISQINKSSSLCVHGPCIRHNSLFFYFYASLMNRPSIHRSIDTSTSIQDSHSYCSFVCSYQGSHTISYPKIDVHIRNCRYLNFLRS